MRARWTTIVVLALAGVLLGWALHVNEPPAERPNATDTRESPGEAREVRDAPDSPEPAAAPEQSAGAVGVHERAAFVERARHFFAQAPALPLEDARQQADDLSRELSRIEQAGGLAAGETFLLRAGLIRYTVADEQEQITQIRALKARYEADARRRNSLASSQSDPMFQLYKVRESQIVAETQSLQVIPDGLSRDEYLRRRLQAERERLLGNGM